MTATDTPSHTCAAASTTTAVTTRRQQRADLDVVLAFNSRMSAVINEGMDVLETEAFLDPDPLRYMWVDEGQGRIRAGDRRGPRAARPCPSPRGAPTTGRPHHRGLHPRRPAEHRDMPDGARLTAWVEWVPAKGDVVQALFEAPARCAEPTGDRLGRRRQTSFGPPSVITTQGVPWVFYGKSTRGKGRGLGDLPRRRTVGPNRCW
ncbi:MAG: hypothetical protein WKF73_15550 [Nocardioidaceae bacterium]